jgi:hypothetical protein
MRGGIGQWFGGSVVQWFSCYRTADTLQDAFLAGSMNDDEDPGDHTIIEPPSRERA